MPNPSSPGKRQCSSSSLNPLGDACLSTLDISAKDISCPTKTKKKQRRSRTNCADVLDHSLRSPDYPTLDKPNELPSPHSPAQRSRRPSTYRSTRRREIDLAKVFFSELVNSSRKKSAENIKCPMAPSQKEADISLALPTPETSAASSLNVSVNLDDNCCSPTSNQVSSNKIDIDNCIVSDIDRTFQKRGVSLYYAVLDILHKIHCQLLHADAVPPQMLMELSIWKDQVEYAALGLILWACKRSRGHANINILDNTRSLSNYMWWRVHKIIADVEVIVHPATKADHQQVLEYFYHVAALFLELWMGFELALVRDFEVDPLTTLGGGRTQMEASRLGQTRWLFSVVLNPETLPDLSTPTTSPVRTHEQRDPESIRNQAQEIYRQLHFFLKCAPISLADLRQTTMILYADAITKSEDVHSKRLHRLQAERPTPAFDAFLKDVGSDIACPTTSRIVRKIYRDLRKERLETPVLCHALRFILDFVPDFFHDFESLVPDTCISDWKKASKRTREYHKIMALVLKHKAQENRARAVGNDIIREPLEQTVVNQSVAYIEDLLKGEGSWLEMACKKSEVMDETNKIIVRALRLYHRIVPHLRARYTVLAPEIAATSLMKQCEEVAKILVKEGKSLSWSQEKEDSMVETAVLTAGGQFVVVNHEKSKSASTQRNDSEHIFTPGSENQEAPHLQR